MPDEFSLVLKEKEKVRISRYNYSVGSWYSLLPKEIRFAAFRAIRSQHLDREYDKVIAPEIAINYGFTWSHCSVSEIWPPVFRYLETQDPCVLATIRSYYDTLKERR